MKLITGERMNIAKQSNDCEKDCRELQHALYRDDFESIDAWKNVCLLYTSPSPRDRTRSRMPSSA